MIGLHSEDADDAVSGDNHLLPGSGLDGGISSLHSERCRLAFRYLRKLLACDTSGSTSDDLLTAVWYGVDTVCRRGSGCRRFVRCDGGCGLLPSSSSLLLQPCCCSVVIG